MKYAAQQIADGVEWELCGLNGYGGLASHFKRTDLSGVASLLGELAEGSSTGSVSRDACAGFYYK